MNFTVKASYTALITLLSTLSSLLSDSNPRLSRVLGVLGLLGVPLIYVVTKLLVLPDYQLVLLLLAGFTTAMTSLHSTGYYKYMYGATKQTKLVLNAVCALLVLLFSSTTMLELLVYWLLLDIIVAFTAITLERGFENLRVAATYLVTCVAPSDIALLTLWSIIAVNKGLYESLLFDITSTGAQLDIGLALSLILLLGFSAKMGQFPLHSWPPVVYGESPPHVSAILSSVVSKIGLLGYLLASRLFSIHPVALYVLLAQGVVSTAYGAFAAALQTDVRRLLAYSSISYYGVITVFYAISSLLGLREAFYLALLVAIYHGVLKAQAFTNSSVVYQVANTYDIYRLGYILYISKLSALSGFLILANLVGMPPTVGFFVKVSTLTLTLSILAENLALIPVLVVLIIHAVFAVMYSAKFLSIYTSTLPRALPVKYVEIPRDQVISELTLGFSSIALSVLILWLLGYSPEFRFILALLYSVTVVLMVAVFTKYYRALFIPEESKFWLTGVES